MDTAVRHRIMRIEDFLAWECRQEGKFEFDGCEPVGMAGGSRRHAAIQRNLAIAVEGRLQGQPCEFFGSDLKIVTAELVRYPDGQVCCDGAAGHTTFTTAPVVVFEVVSPSTTRTDHVTKREEYQAIPSVGKYILLEQDVMSVTVHTRRDAGWATETLQGVGVLDIPQLGLSIPVAELYAKVVIDAG